MESTAAIIVILFVVSIFSSFGGNKGYSPPSTDAPPAPAPLKDLPPIGAVSTKEVYKTAKPSGPIDPTYFAVVGENSRSSIENYISSYRKPAEAADIADSIMKHSQAYQVNPKLIAALIARESRFNPRAVSSSGALGLGQLLPSTCKSTGVDNAFDIDQNVKGTVRYMKYLLGRFKDYTDQVSFALAGYLEGPNAVARNQGYKAHTRSYVEDILDVYNKI